MKKNFDRLLDAFLNRCSNNGFGERVYKTREIDSRRSFLLRHFLKLFVSAPGKVSPRDRPLDGTKDNHEYSLERFRLQGDA